MVPPDNGMLFSTKKKWAIRPWKNQGRTLKACYQVKEDTLKRLHTVWFQLYDILEKAKLCREWKDQWLPGVSGAVETEDF